MSSIISLSHHCVKLTRRSTISIGRYGSFAANHILGRPYYLTFEILDKVEGDNASTLRVVSAAELYADVTEDNGWKSSETGVTDDADTDEKVYEVVQQNGNVVIRTNRETIDDPGTQIMTMAEIEALKAEGAGSGKELITKILESHSALDQKTAFALAKYTSKKMKKYMRRFTVLPLDVPLLAYWMLAEKEPMKIMELREELLALIGSWSNVHYGASTLDDTENCAPNLGRGRWLVIDETAGLLVASMAERMGILYPDNYSPDQYSNEAAQEVDDDIAPDHFTNEQSPETALKSTASPKIPQLSYTNTITVLHANSQPNLSLLHYFHYDSSNPSPTHPLTAHLRTLSWLQLLHPSEDSGYTEPPFISPSDLLTLKSSKRGTYHRKRRRWARIKSIVDETRLGNFDGLVVASVMNPTAILHRTVPLLRGAAQVVVYSPHIEPLAELADYFSTARRTAFLTLAPEERIVPSEDFPVNPSLLLAPTVQTARCRKWQVLPGRTHPVMTSRGGAEGYVFTATRVLPAEGRVQARGSFKRRKVVEDGSKPEGRTGMESGGDQSEATAMFEG